MNQHISSLWRFEGVHDTKNIEFPIAMTRVPATSNGLLVADLGENSRIIDLSDKINEQPPSTVPAQHDINKESTKTIPNNNNILQWLTETAPNIIYDCVIMFLDLNDLIYGIRRVDRFRRNDLRWNLSSWWKEKKLRHLWGDDVYAGAMMY